MDDSNDIPSLDDIGDMQILGGTPAETTSTADETTTAPVQPAAPGRSTTETATEGEPTTPTDKPSEGTPASEPNQGEPTKLTEGQTPPAQQAWIERQRTKSQVTQQINQEYAPPTEQQLLEQGMSEQEAKVQAAIEQLSFERERSRVSELNAGMRDEAVQIQQQFDVFNPNSPNYDAEFAEQVGESYKQYARLQTDENNIILNADVPLYDYYQQQANLYNRGLSRGQQKAQANSEQMLARTENPGGSSSKSSGDLSQEEFLAQYGDAPLF